MKEPHDALSVPRTVAAMLVAPFGAVAAHLAVSAALGEFARVGYPLSAALLVGVLAGLAGLVLVLPLLLLVPRLRLVPWWAAVVWGAAVAALVSLALLGGPSMMSLAAGTGMATLGAASGLIYAITARALMRLQMRV